MLHVYSDSRGNGGGCDNRRVKCECDWWWWRGSATCISSTVAIIAVLRYTAELAVFSHENSFVCFRSIRGLAVELLQCVLSAVIRHSMTDFRFYFHFFFAVLHMYTLCPFFITYVLLQHTYTRRHEQVYTRDLNLSAFLSCHTIRALLLYFTSLHFTLLFFWYHCISYLFPAVKQHSFTRCFTISLPCYYLMLHAGAAAPFDRI